MDHYNNLIKTNILFGDNEENGVGRLIKYQGGSKVLLYYSKTSVKISNLIDKVKRSLKNSGLEVVEHLFNDSDLINCISDGIKLCTNEHVDYVLIVGGAKLFSSGKIIAAASAHSKNLFELFKSDSDVEISLPVGIISTTICGGLALDNYVSIQRKLDDSTCVYHECRSNIFYPEFVVYSPELCQYDSVSLEGSLVRIFSIMAERFFSNNKAQLLSEKTVVVMLKTVLATYEKLKEKTNDAQSLSNLIFASINAHINPMFNITIDSATRTLSNAVVSVFSIPLEHAASLVFPSWFTFMKNKNASKLATFGRGVFDLPSDLNDNEVAMMTIQRVKKFFSDLSLPVKWSQIGADASDIDRILFKVGFPEINSIGTFEKLSKLDCEVLLSFAI